MVLWPKDTPYKVCSKQWILPFHSDFSMFQIYLSCIYEEKMKRMMIFINNAFVIYHPIQTIQYLSHYLQSVHYYQNEWNDIIQKTQETLIFDSVGFCNLYQQLFQILMILFKASYMILHHREPFPIITSHNAWFVIKKPIWNYYMEEWHQTMPSLVWKLLQNILNQCNEFHKTFQSTITGEIYRSSIDQSSNKIIEG